MQRIAILACGLLAYVGFNLSFLYLGAWGAGLLPNVGPEPGTASALALDLGLVLLFGVTHSVMARVPMLIPTGRILPRPAPVPAQ